MNKIDSNSDSIVIYLDDSILENTIKRVESNLKSFINFPITYENKVFTIWAKLNNEEFSLLYKDISEILAAFKIELINSENVNDQIEDFTNEEINFEKFSKIANEIWNGVIEHDDLRNFTEIVKEYLPTRRLYDKQLLAAKHLAFSQNACNFSVPGTGKTTCVYAAFAYLNAQTSSSEKYINKIFVIGPKSCFTPWEEEYKDCFNKKVNSYRIGSSEIEDFLQVSEVNSDTLLYLINYQKLTHEKYFQYCISILSRKDSNFMLVIDEAHKIKNSEGVWAKKILQLSKYAKSRVVLTGTPLPQGYHDLYNLFKFIYPTKNIIPYSIPELKRITKNPVQMRSQILRLTQSILPFFIRIRKTHLQDLIAPIENPPFEINLTPTEFQIYNLVEQGVLNIKNKRTCYIRLLQASSNPILLKSAINKYDFSSLEFEDLDEINENNNQIEEDESEIDNNLNLQLLLGAFINSKCLHSKMASTIRQAYEIIKNGEKVIIWAIFSKSIEMLYENLTRMGLLGGILVGEGNPINSINSGLSREEVINKFKCENEFQFVIANAAAVGESISLHKCCHNAIYYELSYDAAQLIQSKDRIHRVGIPEGILTKYFYFTSANTIENKIFRVLNRKIQRMNQVIEGDEIPILSIFNNDDTLKEIFENYVSIE
jgi:SNF2 family DNA or RNA helicase